MKNVTKVPADRWRDGYGSFRLRKDVAEAYTDLYREAHSVGIFITSAGSMRRPKPGGVKSSRSSTSLHYLGRALDLHTRSGFFDLDEDPYWVEPRGDLTRKWRVYAPTECGEYQRVVAARWIGGGEYVVENIYAHCICLTDLFAEHGFTDIPYRSSFKTGNYMSAEWWHFEYHEGLIAGETEFGDELEKIWSASELKGSSAWDRRHNVWDGSKFA